MFRNADGGLDAVLDAMRFSSGDETISTFLKKYDSLPIGDRERLPWEAIAIAAKLDLRQLAGAMMFALNEASVSTVKIIALSSHPKVMQKTIDYAMLPGGDRDRTIVHRALGFLPDPKGPTFIGKAVFGPSGERQEQENRGTTFDGEDDLDDLFPPATAMQEKLIPIRQLLLNK